MLSGRVLASRRAREAEEMEQAARSGESSPRAGHLGRQPAGTASAGSSSVQGSPRAHPPSPPPPAFPRTPAAGPLSPRLQPATPTAPTPPPILAPAPSSPFPATPPRWPSAPAPSLGREMSQTDPLVLEALLPLLSPASGGSASEAGQAPSMGVAGCAMGLAKTMLGVGLVALPRSFLLLGALPASLAFLALAALCHLSCSVLAAAAAAAARSGLPAQRLSYSGVLAAQLGPWAAITLDLATVLNCLGMMTAYLIASGDALVSDEWRAAGAPAWLAALLRSRPAVLALLSLAVLAPLLSFRRLKQTAVASALGVAAVLVWAGATLYLAAVMALRGRAHAMPLWPPKQLRRPPWHRVLLRMAAVLPVVLTAFICQVSFYTVVRELGPPATARRMRRASAGAVAVTLVTTLVLAMGSALVFGGSIGPNVLSCFKIAALRELLPGHDRLALVLALTVRLAYLLSLLAAFPLQMQPFRDSVAWLRHPRTSQEHLEAPPPQGWRFYALTYSTLVAVSAAAIAVPSIWEPLRLVGTTAGAAIAFILPGALALSLAGWRLCSGGGAGGMLLIAVGLLLVVTGIAGTVVH